MNKSKELIIKEQDELLEQRITDDLIFSMYKLIPGRILGSSIIVAIVVAVLWSHDKHGLLMGWGVLMVIAIILMDLNARDFLKNKITHPIEWSWKRRLLIAPLFTGLLWASALFIFYNNASAEQGIFLITIILSLSVGGILNGIYYMPKYLVYVIPMFGALIINFSLHGTFSYIALAGLMLWALIFSISFAIFLHKTMRSELRFRYQSDLLTSELQQKTEEAQQAALAKSKFLAAASHDLRQPLHALSLFVDALKDSDSETERANIFPRIELSLYALRKLFDALLDVSRLDANVVKPESSHFDLAESLNEMVEEFRPEAIDKNIKLKVHAKSVIVETDRLLLERILRNLISNAIRYTDSGGVLLSARLRDNKVLLQIWDTGIGIPDENKEDIFIEFQQLHNSHRDRAQGLGLGLALVRRLCELLGHTLELSSQPGKGSVFGIEIPQGNASMVVSANATPVIHSWNLNGRCILVIDDERDILQAMQTILSKWGCNVVTAESLDDAINELDKKNIVPEIVLSDLRLRDNKTGVEAIDHLRERFGASLPGVLITGDTSPEKISLVEKSGYELLQKPVRPAHLRTVIFHHLTALPK